MCTETKIVALTFCKKRDHLEKLVTIKSLSRCYRLFLRSSGRLNSTWDLCYLRNMSRVWKSKWIAIWNDARSLPAGPYQHALTQPGYSPEREVLSVYTAPVLQPSSYLLPNRGGKESSKERKDAHILFLSLSFLTGPFPVFPVPGKHTVFCCLWALWFPLLSRPVSALLPAFTAGKVFVTPLYLSSIPRTHI